MESSTQSPPFTIDTLYGLPHLTPHPPTPPTFLKENLEPPSNPLNKVHTMVKLQYLTSNTTEVIYMAFYERKFTFRILRN